MILILFSFLAGLVTILSPCILPVLPPILAAGIDKGKLRPLGVVLGLIVSFSFFTLTLSFLIAHLDISPNYLRYFAVLVVGLLGLTMLIPSWGNWFEAKTSGIANFGATFATSKEGFIPGVILGSALGLVWTPCAGPILASIITLTATQSVSLMVVFMTIAYSLGAAIPMLLIAYGGRAIVKRAGAYTEIIRKTFGVLMILTAIGLYFDLPVYVQQFATQYIPAIEVENHPIIMNNLEQLVTKEPAGNEIMDGLFPPKKLGKAPEIIPGGGFVNSPPFRLEDFKGKPVLIDFWTYSCINCIRTFPYLKKWYHDYKDKGLVIIGVHTPEFPFEKDLSNVKMAAKKFDLTYPIVQDNDFMTWQAYHNLYWPAHYLIDQKGNIVYTHFGEGNYVETENQIRKLLNLPPLNEKEPIVTHQTITPETYLGYDRAEKYAHPIVVKKLEDYPETTPSLNHVSLKGPWKIEANRIIPQSDNSYITLRYEAKEVYLVLSGTSPKPLTVTLDGQTPTELTDDMTSPGSIPIHQPRKYDIVKSTYGPHTVTLHVPVGVAAYVFTFGD